MTAFKYHISTKLVGACIARLPCLMLVHAWRRKKRGNLLGRTLCGEGVTIEVHPGMGGAVTLNGKSPRDKIPYGGTDYKEIYYWNQKNFLLQCITGVPK